jgi:indole-3-glycerol phosphate synthase
MANVETGSIVPSTRDLFQAISTRRKSLALIAELDAERAAEDAVRLDDLGVAAFAMSEPGPAMALAARATKSVPMLLLQPVTGTQACQIARHFGADGVAIDAGDVEIKSTADTARSMRMQAFPLAINVAAAARVIAEIRARVLIVKAPSAAEIVAFARATPGVTIIAAPAVADASALRELVGHVDAALIPSSVHAAPGFAELAQELSP